MTITGVSKVFATAISIACAYMAFVDSPNQLIWTIALVGWLPHVFGDR